MAAAATAGATETIGYDYRTFVWTGASVPSKSITNAYKRVTPLGSTGGTYYVLKPAYLVEMHNNKGTVHYFPSLLNFKGTTGPTFTHGFNNPRTSNQHMKRVNKYKKLGSKKVAAMINDKFANRKFTGREFVKWVPNVEDNERAPEEVKDYARASVDQHDKLLQTYGLQHHVIGENPAPPPESTVGDAPVPVPESEPASDGYKTPASKSRRRRGPVTDSLETPLAEPLTAPSDVETPLVGGGGGGSSVKGTPMSDASKMNARTMRRKRGVRSSGGMNLPVLPGAGGAEAGPPPPGMGAAAPPPGAGAVGAPPSGNSDLISEAQKAIDSYSNSELKGPAKWYMRTLQRIVNRYTADNAPPLTTSDQNSIEKTLAKLAQAAPAASNQEIADGESEAVDGVEKTQDDQAALEAQAKKSTIKTGVDPVTVADVHGAKLREADKFIGKEKFKVEYTASTKSDLAPNTRETMQGRDHITSMTPKHDNQAGALMFNIQKSKRKSFQWGVPFNTAITPNPKRLK